MSPPFPAGSLEVRWSPDCCTRSFWAPEVEGTLVDVDKFILLEQKLKVIHKEQGVA